jgi:DNA primase
MEHYHKQLMETESGLRSVNYLKLRGLTKEVATFFKLGYVGEVLPESGHDFMKGRLSIPYITQTGVVQMRFRSLPYDGIPGNPEDSPKIKSEVGSKTTIYNVSALDPRNETVYVCEGEVDTWTAHQEGLPAVGIPGANSWKPVFAKALKFRKVVILADNDDHGEGLQFAQKVQADVRGARIVLMDKGEDVNSFFVKNGPGSLRRKVGLDG